MSVTLPDLSPAERSLFLTLGIRALDAGQPRPFLGDPMAGGILDETGFDVSTFPVLGSRRVDVATKTFDVAIRTKREDEAVAGFVARHPDAVVLDLGSGLDTRVFRVDPPATVDWYDVDLPTVAELRERLVPARSGTHVVHADVATEGWLAEIPADRPAMVVHDGLVPFLSDDAFAALLRRLTGHFAYGETAFNSYTKLAVWTLERSRIFGDVPGTGFNDPRAPERWVPGLRLLDETFIVRSPEVAGYATTAARRLMTRATAGSTFLSRYISAAVLRYGFSEGSLRRASPGNTR